jgi:ABC-type nitrate/sulfonate/bicarbonate transport system ATPase subunit
MTDTEIIGELRHVSKSYATDGGREYKVLDQIDLAVKEGEFLALLGQSGSGKSTILRCLTGLLKPTVGRVLCYGKALDGTINPHASVVFQTFALYPWLTVEQNVAVGLMAKRLSRSEKHVAIGKVIELIGTSTESWEKAATAAIGKASKSLRDLRIAEVSQLDMQIEGGKVRAYRAKVKVSFKYGGED